MKSIVFIFVTLMVAVILAAPRNHKMKRFIPGLEYTNLNDKKLYPEEIAHLLKAAGIKEQEIPAMVETIFEQNDWNRDNALDEVELYGK